MSRVLRSGVALRVNPGLPDSSVSNLVFQLHLQ